ncbi:MAG: zinc-binding alcohol dehydrogenase [Chloroflexi bacterium]|nr:zinc-binding alcohol dehydrogenase [Chloroflexota bacterium]
MNPAPDRVPSSSRTRAPAPPRLPLAAAQYSVPGAVRATPHSQSVWFAGPGAVELRSEPLPDVAPDEVLVRAVVSALSQGTELLVYRGQVPSTLELDLPTLRGSFGFPIKYGYASVGRVVQTGDEVRDLQAGDLVFVHHPHQTEYVVPAGMPVRLPPELDPEVGVFTANVETAVNVLLDANPRLGERVVVFGQGVVGLLLTQLARRAGAGLVVAVDPLDARRTLSRQVGADVALAPGDDLVEAIRELTDGVGADLVLEASGSSAALQSAIDCVAFQGTVVVCSWYGTKSATLELGGAFHRRRLRIVSSQVSTIDPALQPRWTPTRRLALARDLLPTLQLRSLVTQRVPFPRAAEAYDLVDRHPEQSVQVVLTY